MNRPEHDLSLRTVARRVVDVVRTEVQPAFADALVREVSTGYGLSVTDDERAAVARQLPDAAAGHDPQSLDEVVARLLADHRVATEGARARRETLEAFGERMRDTALRDPDEPPAVSLTGEDLPPWSTRSCAVAHVPLVTHAMCDIGDVGDNRAVAAAAVLADAYLKGDWLGGFRAVDEAVRRLDSGDLHVDDRQLLSRLNCWREFRDRVPASERAALVARVLGLHDARRPADVTPDPRIQSLLDALLDAVDASCSEDVGGRGPSAAARGGLRRARQAVRARLTSTVSDGAIVRIQQLRVQFEQARWILAALARLLRHHGRRSEVEGCAPGDWFALWALLGDELDDGTDRYSGAVTAEAWRVVFEWLHAGGDTVDGDLCEAAALLRPSGRSRTPSIDGT